MARELYFVSILSITCKSKGYDIPKIAVTIPTTTEISLLITSSNSAISIYLPTNIRNFLQTHSISKCFFVKSEDIHSIKTVKSVSRMVIYHISAIFHAFCLVVMRFLLNLPAKREI